MVLISLIISGINQDSRTNASYTEGNKRPCLHFENKLEVASGNETEKNGK